MPGDAEPEQVSVLPNEAEGGYGGGQHGHPCLRLVYCSALNTTRQYILPKSTIFTQVNRPIFS